LKAPILERGTRTLIWQAVGYGIVLEAMLVAAILFWPNFEENIASLKKMAPLPVLKQMVDTLAQEGISAYVNGQHFFKGCNTLGVAAAVLFAMGAVAGEVHRGTLEIWLARPFSRRRMLLERYGAGALALVVPIFLTSATAPWLLGFVEEDMSMSLLMLASVHQSLFLLCIFSATFLCSSLGRNPTKIAFVMLFFTTFEFAIYMVKTVTHYSIFRLTDIQAYLDISLQNSLSVPTVVSMLAFSAVCATLSVVAFERRVP
jgi:ABC-type transport system involved in multi-copper enzyme maturation permease subunit